MNLPKTKNLLAGAALGAVALVAQPAAADNGLNCAPGEAYIMNVMVSEYPYWVPVY